MATATGASVEGNFVPRCGARRNAIEQFARILEEMPPQKKKSLRQPGQKTFSTHTHTHTQDDSRIPVKIFQNAVRRERPTKDLSLFTWFARYVCVCVGARTGLTRTGTMPKRQSGGDRGGTRRAVEKKTPVAASARGKRGRRAATEAATDDGDDASSEEGGAKTRARGRPTKRLRMRPSQPRVRDSVPPPSSSSSSSSVPPPSVSSSSPSPSPLRVRAMPAP